MKRRRANRWAGRVCLGKDGQDQRLIGGDLMTTYIIASNNSGKALVDKDVAHGLEKYKWHVKKDGYMYRNASTEELKRDMPRSIAMHRQLMGFPKGKTIDNINQDKLENKISNIRVASYTDNEEKYKWYVKKDGYMYRNASTEELKRDMPRSIAMHRQLMGFPKGKTIDHINHDKLDNRLSNLRVASYADNQANSRKLKRTSSKYKGVRYHRRDNVWHAYITIKSKQKHLGTFKSEKDRSEAYNNAAKRFFGEFALLNNLEERA